jgi:transposase-like protein
MEARKLTMYQAEKVREYAEMGASYNQLAIRFGVSKEIIKNIVRKKTYLKDKEYGSTLF